MESIFSDPILYPAFIRGMLVALIGMVFWFVRLVYIEVKKMQKHRYRSEVIDEKVQVQLNALQESHNALQKDIDLILTTVLNSAHKRNRFKK